MPAGPVQDSLQKLDGLCSLRGQTFRQGSCLFLGEIAEFDALTHVERSRARILDQVGWGRYTQEAERQAGQLGIFGSAVVAFPDRREEFVGRERQTLHRVDFVHEYHDPARAAQQHYFPDRTSKALQRRDAEVGQPEIFKLIVQVELPGDVAQKTVVPLLGRQVLADGSQVENGDRRVLLAQPIGSMDHQRRLAHLPRSQDVAKLTLLEANVKFAVRLPLDIAGSIAGECAAGNVERRLHGVHCKCLFR